MSSCNCGNSNSACGCSGNPRPPKWQCYGCNRVWNACSIVGNLVTAGEHDLLPDPNGCFEAAPDCPSAHNRYLARFSNSRCTCSYFEAPSCCSHFCNPLCRPNPDPCPEGQPAGCPHQRDYKAACFCAANGERDWAWMLASTDMACAHLSFQLPPSANQVFIPERNVAEHFGINPCLITGACCVENGACLENREPCACAALGGEFHAEKTCAEAACGTACCGCDWCCNMPLAQCTGSAGGIETKKTRCITDPCDLPKDPPCRKADFVLDRQRQVDRVFPWRSTVAAEFVDGLGCRAQLATTVALTHGTTAAPLFEGYTCGRHNRRQPTSTRRGYFGKAVPQMTAGTFNGVFRMEMNYHKNCPLVPNPCL